MTTARVRCAVLCLLSLATPSLATAAAGDDDGAKFASEAYERGMARFRLDEFEGAINEWQSGFRTKPAPQFLYNIAQAYKAWKKPDKAITFYKKYLDMDPKARNRTAVEHTIATLEQQVKDNPPPPDPTPVTTPPPVVTTTTPAPSPAPAPIVTTATTATLVATPEPAKKPITKRAWFWGVVGTGIVVVAGAVVVGVVLGTRSSGPHTLGPVTF